MNVHIHIAKVEIHNHDNDKLDEIIKLLSNISKIEKQMSQELDNLTAEVAANTDAEASAAQLLGQLHDLLVAAGTDPAKLADLTNQLATSKDALAAAIVANTPAASSGN